MFQKFVEMVSGRIFAIAQKEFKNYTEYEKSTCCILDGFKL